MINENVKAEAKRLARLPLRGRVDWAIDLIANASPEVIVLYRALLWDILLDFRNNIDKTAKSFHSLPRTNRNNADE